jgi:hypothetical protein
MPKKAPAKKVVNAKPMKNRDEIQIDVKKQLDDDKKINPKKIFDGYSTKKSTTKKSTTKKKSY